MTDLNYVTGLKNTPIIVIGNAESEKIINKILREKYGMLDAEIKGIFYGEEPASYNDIAAEIARIFNSFEKN
jgi:hypothetical protein